MMDSSAVWWLLVLLSPAFIQVCEANCYGCSSSWFSVWYFWLLIVGLIMCCCGGVASLCRRKKKQQQMQQMQQQAQLQAGQVPPGVFVVPGSAMSPMSQNVGSAGYPLQQATYPVYPPAVTTSSLEHTPPVYPVPVAPPAYQWAAHQKDALPNDCKPPSYEEVTKSANTARPDEL